MAEYYAELQQTVYETEVVSVRYTAELNESVQILDARLQSKSATPTQGTQEIRPDAGYDALSAVTVNPIPSNYGLITWNGSVLTVS